MSWKIEIKPNAEKYYLKLGKANRKRIKETLKRLEGSPNPLHEPNVRALTGRLQGDYRLRVGKYRILFTPYMDRKIIVVFAILPRGDAY